MKNICITIAMFVLCSACNDWLDVQPTGQLAREELFNDYAGFKDALTGCYMSMCADDAYGRKLTMHVPDIMAQLWTVYQDGELGAYRSIANFDYHSEISQSVFKAIWGGLYRVIVQANAIIEKVDAKADVFPSERERAIVEAEARAIRACCHLDVLRLFGQMPQGGGKTVALPYTEDVSRDPKTYYVYDEFCGKLEIDLNRAAALLKEHDIICEKGRWTTWGLTNALDDKLLTNRDLHFNYFAVKALQARYALYVGKKAEAYAAAKEIITHEEAGKLADNSDYTKGYYTKPSEALFHLNRSDWNNTKNREAFGTPDDQSTAPISIASSRLTELYPSLSDNRRNNSFSNKIDNSGFQKLVLRKYYQNTLLIGTTPYNNDLIHNIQVIPVLRTSEVYLVAMETGDDLSEINQLYYEYMTRRGVLVDEQAFDSLEAARQEVIDEYRREFFGEGQMFFVYKRTGAVTMRWSEGNVGENQYIVPIPLTEYSAN